MGLAARVKALVAHRRILWLLVRRELKVRYAGSALGYVWTILDPLMMILVYWFVFSFIFKRGGIGEEPYILYLAFGQLSWQWFNSTVSESCRALESEKRLVRSTQLPREIWVLKVVVSKGLEFMFSLPVLVLFMILYRKPPTLGVIYFPLGLIVQAILLTGLGLILASVTVLVRDVARVVRIILRVMFYATPVIYSVQRVPEGLREVYALNPLTGIMGLYRASIFPQDMASPVAIASGVVISFAVLFFGAWVFARLESPVLKEL